MPEPAQATVAPHEHHVERADRKAPVDLLALGHVGEAKLRRPAFEVDAAATQRQKPGDGLEQGRLAGAVRPHHSDLAAGLHLERHTVQSDVPVVVHHDVAQLEADATGDSCHLRLHLRFSTITWVSYFIMAM